MALAPGTRLGPYEVETLLGSGGMGDVYKARDTRLNRTIALKVLRELKARPETRIRFTTEARAVASLNHPHICSLYDVGYEDGVDFLVEEYCDGATLADRLRKGPLTIDESLRYAIQVAEALDHAHARGFIHRDLKPSNIALSGPGAKLLDFGLAQLGRDEPPQETVDTSTTSHDEGEPPVRPLAGTRQYMAPEQLEGKGVDQRADIFAFGAVLYEMLTGRKAFVADTPVSLIAAVLTSDPPPVSTLRPATPIALERLIHHCLAKSPLDRWSSMHDVLLQLRGIFDVGGARARVEEASPERRVPLGWLLAATILVAGAIVWIGIVRRPSPAPGPLVRFPMAAPETAAWSPLDAMIVSPDGRRFAFVASTGTGKPLLWIRLIDSLSAQPLAGTEGAYHPFWSPDSQFVGFFANGQLKTIEVSGGPPHVVCEAPFGRTGAWSGDGVIVFARSARDPLYGVSATGGVPAAVTALDEHLGEWTHRAPQFLPDGRHFLFLARSTQPEHQTLYVGMLGSGARTALMPIDSAAVFAPPSHLVYRSAGTLVARAFDVRALRLDGDPLPLAYPVGYDLQTDRPFFSASKTGVLTYRGAGDPNMQLVWYDRQGRPLGTLGPPGQYWDLALSPDQTRVAVARLDSLVGTRDIWIVTIADGTIARLTFDPGNEFLPVWSADGTRILYATDRGGTNSLIERPVNSSGGEQVVTSSSAQIWATDWSRDGRFVVYALIDRARNSRSDLWLLSRPDGQASALVATPFRETHARISPDGHWFAYSSDQSGRAEVYVDRFPMLGDRRQVSAAGGAYPAWSADGRELFYLDGDANLDALAVTPGASFEVAARRVLFQTGLSKVSTSGAGLDYAVTRDGRILTKAPLRASDSSSETVVLNWSAAIQK